MADEDLPDWARDDPKGDTLPDWARDSGGDTATATKSITPETDRAISQGFSTDQRVIKPPVNKPWWQQVETFAKKPSPQWLQPFEKGVQWHPPASVMPVTWYAKGVEALAPHLPQSMQGAAQGYGAYLEGLGEATAGLFSPANIAVTAASGGAGVVAEKAVAGMFLGQAILGTPAQWRALKAAPTMPEKIKIATGMAASYLPGLAFAHGFKGGEGGAGEAKPGEELPPPPTSPFTPAIVDDEAKIPVVSETAMPPPPMAPGGIIGERNVGPVIEQSREQPGVTYANPVKSAESLLKRDEGTQVGPGTSLWPLNKGAAGTRPGEESVSTGPTLAPQTPATDAVTPVEQKVQHGQFGKPGYTAVDDDRVTAARQVTAARTVDEILQAAGYTHAEINQMPSNRAIQLANQLHEQAASILKDFTDPSKAGGPAPEPDKRDTELREFRPAADIGADLEPETYTPKDEAAALEKMRREDEQERLENTQEHMARGGDELVDVLKAHGLPLTGEAAHYKGELNNIREMFASIGSKTGRKGLGSVTTGTGEKLTYQNIFKKGSEDVDSLVNTMRQKGFTNPDGSLVETPADALRLIEDRLRTGKKVYGSEARAQSLEEQSYQDYQGPMGLGVGRRLKPSYDTPAGSLKVSPKGYVSNIFIKPENRGQGAGRDLLQRVTSDADAANKELTLHSRQDLIPFYEKFGFRKSGEDQFGPILKRQPRTESQAPMKTERHPFGGQGEPWRASESDKPGIEKSPEQLDKDLAIAAKEEEKLPLPDNEVGTEIVATSMDEEQMERLVGKDMYKKSFTNTVINELLQNSFDAVRDGGASEKNPGKISIDYDYNTRTIKVRDNGVGMSPETIVSSFLRTGGTKKSGDPRNTSGGLGLAKLTFVKGSSRIRLETVKDGLKSVMDVNAAQIKAKQIPLVKTRTNEPNGTTVTVEVPKSYVDLNGETQSIHFDTDPDVLKNPLFGPVEVTVNGKTHPMGIHTTGWEKDNTFNFRWGHADVYVDPKPLGKYSWGDTMQPKYRVMSAGLYQFDISPYNIFKNENEFIPHNMVIDVRPHVDTKDPQYPFDNQREGWRGSVTADMKSMYAFLKKQGLEQRLKKDQETFSKVEVIPHVEMGDLEKNLSKDQVAMGDAREGAKGITTLPKVVSVDVKPDAVTTNYDTGKKDVQSHEQFQKSTFSSDRIIDFDKSKLDTTHLRPEDPLFHNNTNVDFNQIKGAPELHSKVGNLLVHFMRAFGQRFGTDPTARHEYGQLANTVPGHSWLGGISYDTEYAGLNTINPFKAIWINPAGLSEGAMKSGPKRAAVEQLHTFLHEITHVPERNEGGGFTREEMNNVGRMVDFPPHEKFVKALVDVYTKHWDTLNEIRRRFHDPDTKNRSESFKAGSALGAESRGGKGADKGLPGKHVSEDERVQKQGPTGPGRATKADRPTGSLGDIIAGQAAASKRARSATAPGTAPGTPQTAPAPGTGAAAGPAPAAAFREGIRDTLSGIKKAVADRPAPPTPPVEPVEAPSAREPTQSEKAFTPGKTLTEDQMGKVTRDTFARLTAPRFTGGEQQRIAYMPRNRVVDGGREAIRNGVDPEEIVRSNQVPNDQKYAVARAHSEDLREAADQADKLSRKSPTLANKDAYGRAFADFANWNKQELEPLKTLVNTEFPEMEQEPFDPRHYTDLHEQFVKKNKGRDPSATEKEMLNRHAERIQKTISQRNDLLNKYDADLERRAPELLKNIKTGKDLFNYVADVIGRIAPCN